MSSLVNFQIFATRKCLPTAGKLTHKWLLAGVNANVVDELVLCFERGALSRATVPVASVIGVFCLE